MGKIRLFLSTGFQGLGVNSSETPCGIVRIFKEKHRFTENCRKGLFQTHFRAILDILGQPEERLKTEQKQSNLRIQKQLKMPF